MVEHLDDSSVADLGVPGLKIGGHVSLGPKPDLTLDGLCAAGFSSFQLHVASPRQWRIPEKRAEDFQPIAVGAADRNLTVFIHAIYLINLASARDEFRESSIASLLWSMRVAGWLGARAVTFHVGSHRGQGFDSVRGRIAAALEEVLEQCPAGPRLLLENSAGGGDIIGSQFGELGTIIADAGSPPNLGICLDTAHAFASGHDLRSFSEVDNLLELIDKTAGLNRLHLVHVNDSKTELGSHRDRHENIGVGCIGEEGFVPLLARSEIAGLPLILETPNPEKRGEDLAALQRARQRALAHAA